VPELPEVEHARRVLGEWLGAATLEGVAARGGRLLGPGASAGGVVRALSGRRVCAVERRGKWLRLGLDRGAVFSHLGMTGKWVVAALDDAALPHERVRLDVRQGRRRRSVRYTDPRGFGRFLVVGEGEPPPTAWSTLGPDPLLDGVDAPALHGELASRRQAVKAALLDQTLLAGLGNIQATEALYHARIDPRRPARTLSRAEVARLARGIGRTLADTLLRDDGATITYVAEAGASNPFAIYGHQGEPCPGCARPLQKVVVAGRGTVFCARCQR
jgi:formamidopyrimidine-DNA glycosylase